MKEITEEIQVEEEREESRVDDTGKPEYLYVVSVLKNSHAEKEILSHPETRVLEAEPQRSHLTFLLLPVATHTNILKK